MAHYALYGNTHIPRTYCRSCKSNCLILDGLKACCDRPTKEGIRGFKRMSEPEKKRRKYIDKELRQIILNEQDHRCLYCEKKFHDTVLYKGRRRIIKIEWDHVVPFVYNQNNRDDNFVAACCFCNGWKYSKTFSSIEEIKIYVNQKWQDVYDRNLREAGVPEGVSEATGVEAVL